MNNELFSVEELEARFEMEAMTAGCSEHVCCEHYSCSVA